MLFLRAAPVVLGFLIVLYICTFYYLRDQQKDALAAQSGDVEPAFLDAQLKTYTDRLRKQLAIYIIAAPLGAITLFILLLENL